jgi:hypothetical protein
MGVSRPHGRLGGRAEAEVCLLYFGLPFGFCRMTGSGQKRLWRPFNRHVFSTSRGCGYGIILAAL